MIDINDILDELDVTNSNHLDREYIDDDAADLTIDRKQDLPFINNESFYD